MANSEDAKVVLELYKIRQEPTLRAARKFIGNDFWPKNLEELRAVSRAQGTEHNAYWRQVMTYWEMAASLVLRNAVDTDLFLDSQVEGIFIYAKFHHWHAETEKESGNIFMKNTAKMIERFPAAKLIYEGILKSLASQPR